MTTKEKYAVLIADDDEEDRFLLKAAIQSVTPRLKVVAEVENGEQVIAYLSGIGPYHDRQRHPFPDLLLIDLVMPVKNGFEVLEWLNTKCFPQLKVAVVSGSLEDLSHRQRILRLGVQHFYSKMVNYDELLQSVKFMQDEMEMLA
ncbi:response regulator receiver protein [Pedosphaera parvula Ellin514]|uniref:Response regulator receiver protein n=2 Tax=Pedosphaera TaxID=1032526 RepID=B9XL91_PEDPL|nr:response regulator receiver protein [Pedosphaera parvula Ellin514]